jgi:predicted ATPase
VRGSVRADSPAVKHARQAIDRAAMIADMNDEDIREHAQAMCDALVAGDVELAVVDFSDELRRNLGEVLALLPLPATEATVESVERGASGYTVMLRIAGAAEEVELQTRWKERDGEPNVVEASHLSRTPTDSAAETASELPDGGEAPI